MTPEKAEAPYGGFAADHSGGRSAAHSTLDTLNAATEAGTGSLSDALDGAAAAALSGSSGADPQGAAGVVGFGLENRATSNSTVCRRFSADWGVWVCLDRLSFVVRVRRENLKGFERWLRNSAVIGEQVRANTPGYRQAWRFCGGVMECGDRASGAGSGSGVKLRFDFNPQKAPADALAELAAFVYADSLRYTRVDVAIDYMRHFGDCSADHDTLQKAATYGAGKHLTGWTFGSRRGGRYTRVYDKRREREDKGYADDTLLEQVGDAPLWRCEVESRPHGRDALPAGLFDGLHLRNLSAEPLSWRELAVMRCCMADPLFIKRIPTEDGTRKRYQAMLDGITDELEPSPASVYEATRDLLLVELWTVELLISGGEVLHDAPSVELKASPSAEIEVSQEMLRECRN